MTASVISVSSISVTVQWKFDDARGLPWEHWQSSFQLFPFCIANRGWKSAFFASVCRRQLKFSCSSSSQQKSSRNISRAKQRVGENHHLLNLFIALVFSTTTWIHHRHWSRLSFFHCQRDANNGCPKSQVRKWIIEQTAHTNFCQKCQDLRVAIFISLFMTPGFTPRSEGTKGGREGGGVLQRGRGANRRNFEVVLHRPAKRLSEGRHKNA